MNLVKLQVTAIKILVSATEVALGPESSIWEMQIPEGKVMPSQEDKEVRGFKIQNQQRSPKALAIIMGQSFRLEDK